MYTERRIKIQSFIKIQNPNLKGVFCQLNCGTFIDYKEDCYKHPQINVIICEKCRSKKESKMHNVPQQYNGSNYQSTLEARKAKMLDLLLKIGQIKGWERQKKIDFSIIFKHGEPVLTAEPREKLLADGMKYYPLATYKMDFVITHNDDSIEFCETKGFETPQFKMKWILTQACFKDKVKLTLEKEKKKGFKRRYKKA